MANVLAQVYGSLLVVRPPVPATVNKAGANYKSEVTHRIYSPRRAYDEWLSICEGITSFGGDAIFDFEEADEALLDKGDLAVDADGTIRAIGSSTSTRLGSVDEVLTGRVFAANGPWVVVEDRALRALMPHMLSHRLSETAYYERLLRRIAEEGEYDLHIEANPHRWEGMADIAVVARGDGTGEPKVVLTHTVRGHYDAKVGPKTMRSSLEGVKYAADFAGVPEASRIYAELVYPHFHGDTVHFGARPPGGEGKLVHYAGGLFGNESARVRAALGDETIVPIERNDAVEQYVGNSRQVNDGLLVPDGASESFVRQMEGLGLSTRRVPLFELFGKAGGGPACATLYLPKNLRVPENSALRYGANRDAVRARRERYPEQLIVSEGYFQGKLRG